MEDSSKRGNEDTDNWLKKKLKTEGEDVIYFNSEPPTLQRIAIISIACRLWSQPEVIEELRNKALYRTFYCPEYYRKIEGKVLNSLTKNLLPSLLISEISYVIRPIGVELTKWFLPVLPQYHTLRDLCQMGGSIYWTMEGTIDIVRSLKELILNQKPKKDIIRLYDLACKFCLEEYISYLWDKMPYDIKKQQFDDTQKSKCVVYWTYAVNNKLPQLLEMILKVNIAFHKLGLNMHQIMVLWAVKVCNISAFKYFWQKLTNQEINDIIGKLFNLVTQEIHSLLEHHPTYECDSPAGILCLLLSYLSDPIKQKEVLKKHSYVILKSLFQSWLYQRFFLNTLLKMLDYLQEDVYASIMCDIVDDDNGDFRTTQKLFKEVWSVSPSKLKSAFLEKSSHGKMLRLTRVLLFLVKIGDINTAFKLLNDTSTEEKERLTSALLTDGVLDRFIYLKDDLTLFDPLLIEILPPHRNRQSFKLEVLMRYTKNFYPWIYKGDIQGNRSFTKWLPDEYENERQEFKKYNLNLMSIYTSLIFHDDYDRINQSMNWYFENKEDILEFKTLFVQEDNIFHLKMLLIELGSVSNGWDLFEKFQNFNMFSSNETTEFKRVCLKFVEPIVEKCHFEFATRLLNWCLGTANKVNKFKNDLLLSETGVNLLLPIDDSLQLSALAWERFEDLVKWASPLSRDTFTALELLLNSNKQRWDSYGPHWNVKKQNAYEFLKSSVVDTATSPLSPQE